MNFGERIARAVAWEKAVVVLSFYVAVGLLVAGVLVGYVVLPFVNGQQLELTQAVLWSAQAFLGFAVLGTLINGLHLICSALCGVVRARVSRG